MQPSRWQSVRSVFWGCEGVVVCREVVGHQRCAGWLQGLSFLVVCWMVAGVEFPCGLSGGCVASALGWMQWGIGGFCRRVFVDFCWWGGYTEGTYLGTFWAVRLSDPHMVGCINMAGRSRLVV